MSERITYDDGRTVEIEIDRERRYMPSIIVCKAKWVDVQEWIIHPVGHKPTGCPLSLAKGWCIVEAKTERGSRFFSFEGAAINSELRMVVWGFNAGDEVLRNLAKCEVWP
jgi:hypothetical protein